ncbi:MAG: N-formylglutamate amidohydrolase [Alphaproteobacteria bacterium]|nr:N-formylglutamate amidohydrolase [Alphaproteobacteria bacterium]NNF24344.1 N-formylglutamate amidohydrolase [Paracoccaceae bacterium]
MLHPAYQLTEPAMRTTSVIFASPHSGRDYSWSFLRKTVLDERMIRSSEDAFIDMLFEVAPQLGASFLAAKAPRAFVDFNRSREELDPVLIDDIRKTSHNPRISSGLGVIPRVVANGRQIYRGKLSRAEAESRILDYWQPYHDQLQALLDRSHAQFGEAVLIDCHSMPHEAVQSVAHPNGIRPDIVLGDRFGAAASGDVVARIEEAFTRAGLKVVRNAPFAGAYTAQHYGRPSRAQHVVQVEIDRSLYMNEQTIRPGANFSHFKELMAGVISDLAQIGGQPASLAAE